MVFFLFFSSLLTYDDDYYYSYFFNKLRHHRQCIVDLLGEGGAELAYCAAQIEEDAKNYHAWGYRQWYVCVFFFYLDILFGFGSVLIFFYSY